MTEVSVSSRFSWEPASWGQSIIALVRTPPPVSTWFTELEQFDMVSFTKVREKGSPRMAPNEGDQPIENSCTVFHKSIAYLAKYSNAQLESFLVKKFEQILTPEGLKNAFHSILLLSLRTNRPKMLEVCQKVLSSQKLAKLFKVIDVVKLAKKEALVVPKPQHRVASISKSLIHALQQPLLRIRKIIRYVFSTTSQAYGVNFDSPPSNSQRAQGQWTFYRDTLHDICVIFPIIKTCFTVQWKTSIVTATLLAVSITAAYQSSESPTRNISRFKAELPALQDDVQQCHTPAYIQPKREPSVEFDSYLQVLENQLVCLHEERELTLKHCNLARDLNPDWITSDKGIALLTKIEKIDKNFEDHKKKIIEARKLSLRLEKLSQIRLDYSQKEHAIIHFLNEQSHKPTKSFEEFQKNYLFMKYLALPETRREYDTILAKCQAMMFPASPSSRVIRGRTVSTSSLDYLLPPRPAPAATPTNLTPQSAYLQPSVSAPSTLTNLTPQPEARHEHPIGQ